MPAPVWAGCGTATVVMEMLMNEKYAGDSAACRSSIPTITVEKKRFHNRGELPQYYVGEDHEPIIDRRTPFDAVQSGNRLADGSSC